MFKCFDIRKKVDIKYIDFDSKNKLSIKYLKFKI